MSGILKCNPVEMRKNLQVVDSFKKMGIDFVAIPALGKEDKSELLQMMMERIEELEKNK